MPYTPDDFAPFTQPPKPDPERHYRWLNSANAQKFGMHLMSFGDIPGYKLEQGATVEKTKELAEKLGYPDSFVNTATNRIQIAELVLASIPMAEHERRAAESARRLKGERDVREDSAMASMEGPGIRPIKMQVGEFEERKAHASGSRVSVNVPDTPSGRSKSASKK